MPSVFLQNVKGQEGSSFLLFEDSRTHSGRLLLYALANQISERFDQFHVFTTELSPDETSSYIGSEVSSKLILHDIWTDPLGWNNPAEETDPLKLNPGSDFISRLCCRLAPSVSKIVVVIDTISSFLPYHTDSQMCSAILSLVTASERISDIQNVQVLGLLHSDLHSEKTVKALRYLATTQIKLSVEDPSLSTIRDAHGVFEILQNKKNGKVKRQKEVYRVDGNHHLELSVYDQQQKQENSHGNDAQPDPTANLTFNLTLKESERIAKEKVVLPYISNKDKSELVTPPGYGQIFYEPDDADDFDEEDPDDDLDI